jgi:hypothetical protein
MLGADSLHAGLRAPEPTLSRGERVVSAPLHVFRPCLESNVVREDPDAGRRARRRGNNERHLGPMGEVRRGSEELWEGKRPAPAFAGGVEAISRWSSASGPDGVIAKNEAARKPPDRITSTDASRQGCGFRCDESRNASHPCWGASFVCAFSSGFRAATSFAPTPASREALDHRLLARTASGVPKTPFAEQRVGPAPLYVLRRCLGSAHPRWDASRWRVRS